MPSPPCRWHHRHSTDALIQDDLLLSQLVLSLSRLRHSASLYARPPEKRNPRTTGLDYRISGLFIVAARAVRWFATGAPSTPRDAVVKTRFQRISAFACRKDQWNDTRGVLAWFRAHRQSIWLIFSREITHNSPHTLPTLRTKTRERICLYAHSFRLHRPASPCTLI